MTLMINPALNILDLGLPDIGSRELLLKLTTAECYLLAPLAKNYGRVLTHQFILKEVWGYGYLEQTRYLRVFIAQLREKNENNPSNPELLITQSMIGYRFGS